MKKMIQLCAVLGCVIYGWYLEDRADIMIDSKETPALVVHVEGAVNKEGDYTFSDVLTVKEAVNHIGVKEEAALDWMNLTASIEHDMVIYVPTYKEGLISLNQATEDQIDTVPGIGPKKAQAIIGARPFTCLEDLMKVKGIGEKSYRKYRDYFCL